MLSLATGWLAVAGCDSTVEEESLDIALEEVVSEDIPSPNSVPDNVTVAKGVVGVSNIAVTGGSMEVTSTANIKEYCVLATDDAPVDGPELADVLFNNSRFSRAPYQRYSAATRVPTNEFKIGHIPDDSVTNDYTSEFKGHIRRVCEENEESFLDGRAKFIFTGPKFSEQMQDATSYLRQEKSRINGIEWNTYDTKVGTFMTADIAGVNLGVLYFDGWMVNGTN